MQLEDYFLFEKLQTEHGEVERIRIKGSRIRIETIVDCFKQGLEPREIQQDYSTLTLEEVYAAITYYLHNREEVEAYRERGERIGEAYYQDYLREGPYWLRDRALGEKERGGTTPPAASDNAPHE